MGSITKLPNKVPMVSNKLLSSSIADDLRIMKQALIEIAIDIDYVCTNNQCLIEHGKCSCKGSEIIKKIAEEALQKVAGDYNDKS